MSVGSLQDIERLGFLARVLEEHSRRGTEFAPEGTIALDSGDPDFDTPQAIRDALAEAVAAGLTHYGEPFGDRELRFQLAEIESARSVAAFDLENVIITHGASGGLAAATLTCLDPGDRVLIPDPTYSLYADHVRLARAEPVFVPTDARFHLDIDALTAAAPGARLLILNNPCNPTGAVYGRDELEAVGELAERHDLLVLTDEAYDAITYEGVSFTSCLQIESLSDRLIYCQTFSKRYAMTGWRVGYLVAPRALAAAAGRLHFSLHGPLNPAIQRAALAAASLPVDETMLREFARRREAVHARLSAIPGVEALPTEGTFYSFFKYPNAIDSFAMRRLCLEHGVALRAGAEFGDGGEGYLRLSFTSPTQVLDEGLTRLDSAMSSR